MALPWLVGGLIVAGVINALSDDEKKETISNFDEDKKNMDTVTRQVSYSKVPKWARKEK